ncbi:MAG: helix-turn-helix transcriptional regulator [Firmicutes bacterium]|nr:helix-turn-helix transcriptional regulator [Bacillota bacterium]
MLKEEIGERIRRCRADRGLNQAELAEISGLSQNTISDLERDLRYPVADTLLRLAEAFHVTTDYILKGRTADNLNPKLEENVAWVMSLDSEKQEDVNKVFDVASIFMKNE